MFTTYPVQQQPHKAFITSDNNACGPNELNVLVKKIPTFGGFVLNDERIMIYILYKKIDIYVFAAVKKSNRIYF